MTVAELVKTSGIPRGAVYAAIRDGELRAWVPKGNVRGYRVRPSEFERWLEECERGRMLGGDGPAREMVPMGAQMGA